MKPFFQKLLSQLSDAFFPEGIKCICCGDELPRGMPYGLCEKCFKKFPFIDGNICVKCGVSLDNMSGYCQSCKFGPRAFTAARAALFYTGDAARLIKAYKSGDKFLAPYFAGIMFDYYLKAFAGYNIRAACFVPCGKKRLKERGYNQAAELAGLLCEKLNAHYGKEQAETADTICEKNDIAATVKIPLYDCLEEIKAVKKQALLSAAERRENIKGAYAIKEAFHKPDLKHKNIMLIDDIFTTGSTAGECAAILKRAGAKEIYVFALATGKGF